MAQDKICFERFHIRKEQSRVVGSLHLHTSYLLYGFDSLILHMRDVEGSTWWSRLDQPYNLRWMVDYGLIGIHSLYIIHIFSIYNLLTKSAGSYDETQLQCSVSTCQWIVSRMYCSELRSTANISSWQHLDDRWVNSGRFSQVFGHRQAERPQTMEALAATKKFWWKMHWHVPYIIWKLVVHIQNAKTCVTSYHINFDKTFLSRIVAP